MPMLQERTQHACAQQGQHHLDSVGHGKDSMKLAVRCDGGLKGVGGEWGVDMIKKTHCRHAWNYWGMIFLMAMDVRDTGVTESSHPLRSLSMPTPSYSGEIHIPLVFSLCFQWHQKNPQFHLPPYHMGWPLRGVWWCGRSRDVIEAKHIQCSLYISITFFLWVVIASLCTQWLQDYMR